MLHASKEDLGSKLEFKDQVKNIDTLSFPMSLSIKPKKWLWVSPLEVAPIFSDWVDYSNGMSDYASLFSNTKGTDIRRKYKFWYVLDTTQLSILSIMWMDERYKLDPYIHNKEMNYSEFTRDYDALHVVWESQIPENEVYFWNYYFKWWDINSTVVFRASKLIQVDSFPLDEKNQEIVKRVEKLLR